MTRQTFTFGNVNSDDYGVYISGKSVFDSPVKAYDMVPIPGRNGNLAVFNNRYENVELTYPAFIFKDFGDNIQALRNQLLSQDGYQRLIDTYNPDEFRLAVYAGGLEADPVQMLSASEFDIIFDCKPQRFLASGETPVTFSADGAIVNPTLFESRPLIAVTGTGTLGVGSESIIISGSPSGAVYIDCDIMDAYTLSGASKVPYNSYVQYTSNNPPGLKPGSNGISLSGDITQVVITPRWFRL